VADYELIETRADLDALAHDLMSEKVIAVDTEADSFYHYFDKTCLVQIGTRKQIYLIDPLALGGPAELSPLAPVFASPEIRKIFHAAEYDIFVLKRDCSFEFANLFDTMISAQLLGYPSVGLSRIAARHFDVNLPKDEQRSDWSRRPLTQQQMSYAASDVSICFHSPNCSGASSRRSGTLGDEDSSTLPAALAEREVDGWISADQGAQLDRRRSRCCASCTWCATGAREMDRPPFKVLGNRT
jgi:ribonuclease D